MITPPERCGRALAQPLSHVAVMTTDNITNDTDVSVRFGTQAVIIPAPLDTHITALITTGRARYIGIGSTNTSNWLFPGHLPGRANQRRPTRRTTPRPRHQCPSRTASSPTTTRRRSPCRRTRRNARRHHQHRRRRDWRRSLAVHHDASSEPREQSEQAADHLERIAADGTLAAALAGIAATEPELAG